MLHFSNVKRIYDEIEKILFDDDNKNLEIRRRRRRRRQRHQQRQNGIDVKKFFLVS